jgi:hypothetical protein
MDYTAYTRNKVSGNFRGSLPVEYPPKTKYYSPDEKYFFELEVFSKPIEDGVTFGSYFFAKVEIFDHHSQEKIFDVLNDYSENNHQWLEIDGKMYLFFAELHNGMTVYNLTDKTQISYLDENSHHQIIQYFPSPDRLKMATVRQGLQELLILIYDISKPMELPFPVVFSKKIEDSNGKYIKTIDWKNSSDIEIIHHEQIRISNIFLKVQIVGLSDDKWMAKCRFEDIHGAEYFCGEKLEAFGFEIDNHTIFPIEGSVSVNVIKISTQNAQKIATISVDVGYESIQVDVFEHQLYI